MEKIGDKVGKIGWFSDDFIAGLVIVLFAISIFVQVPGSYGDVMLFPKIIGIVCLLCGCVMLAGNFLRPSGRAPRSFKAEGICLAIASFMYVAMIAAGHMGFYACLFLVCFAVNQLIALFCREGWSKSVCRSLIMALFMCGITFVIFRYLLGILTPEGLLI